MPSEERGTMTHKAAAKPAEKGKPTAGIRAAKQRGKSYFPFLKLPTELRIKIYRYLLPDRDIPAKRGRYRAQYGYLSIRFDGHSCYPQILRTCRLIYAEASSIIYDELLFRLVIHSNGIYLCGEHELPSWKQYKRSIDDCSKAKDYLGDMWNVFVRAKKLRISIDGTFRQDWDEYMSDWDLQDGPSFEEKVDCIETAYDSKANVQLLADLLREAACWRKQQNLPRPMVKLVVAGEDDEDYHFNEMFCLSKWFLTPFVTVRGCDVSGIVVSSCDCECYEEPEDYQIWEKGLVRWMSGNPELFQPDLVKRRMQSQINHLMEFMERIGFGTDVEPLRRDFYYARVAFDEGKKAELNTKVMHIITGWNRVLQERKQQEAQVAASFTTVVQTLFDMRA